MSNSITHETTQNLLLDAGVVYINYGLGEGQGERILGATEGGNTFTIEREIKEIEVDGTRGKTKGLRRIIGEDAKLVVNLKEMSAENIALALAGSIVSDFPSVTATHEEVRSTGDVSDSDYIDNVALVAKISGSNVPVVCIVENALSDGNFEIGTSHNDEAVIPVTFSAHYDPEDVTETVPFAVRYPKMVASNVTKLMSTNSDIVSLIVNTLGDEEVTVADGANVFNLISSIKATDGSAQTYAVEDSSGEPKTGTDVLVGTDILVVTAANASTTVEYGIILES